MNILKQKNNKIGFCDSGVGGLTVYSKFRKLVKTEDCIFFGDLKNSPYGNKTKEQLLTYSKAVFDFFKKQQVKAVVMACNTTSATTYSELKDKYPFKIYPIIQSCAKIIANLGYKNIGVFATESTIKSGAYVSEIHKYNNDINVYSQICPEWVDIVESNSIYEHKDLIKKYIDLMIKNSPDKIILGCTHYPYLTDVISEFIPSDMLIDPSEYFVDYIIKDLADTGLLNPQKDIGSEEFFVSANCEEFKKASEKFYNVTSVNELALN